MCGGKTLSSCFSVHSGVRQGSAISPALFNLFVNEFIVNLKNCSAGCAINGHFVGAIMYADDLIILSPTVAGLQKMLAYCEETSKNLGLEFNCKKCSCTAISPAPNMLFLACPYVTTSLTGQILSSILV